MKSKANRGIQKAGRVDHLQGGGPNWVLVAGGVLLSTLSVKLGCKLRQMFDMKQQNSSSRAERRSGGCESHSNLCRFRGQTSCYYCISDGVAEVKHPPASPLPKSAEPSLPLVKIPGQEPSKDTSGVMWITSPDRLEDPRKPFQYSEQFRLSARSFRPDAANGHANNGYADSSVDDPELQFASVEKRKGELERVEMLKREVGELKEVIGGKDFLLHSYKEQKVELSSQIRELQQKLSSQVPNIL
uniref:Uncharacterized protein n=1 Tax=Avena sativa TaxID=4498 RepID=A0ACD5Z269_AVESA